MREHHTGFIFGGFPSLMESCRETSEFNIKPFLGAPLLIFPRDNLLKSFPQVDTSARQRGFEIRIFPLLGELPKAIEPHLPVFQLYRWQLGPNMWSSPTTKSLDPIVVTALRVVFPGKTKSPPHVDLPASVRSQKRGQRRRQGTTATRFHLINQTKPKIGIVSATYSTKLTYQEEKWLM